MYTVTQLPVRPSQDKTPLLPPYLPTNQSLQTPNSPPLALFYLPKPPNLSAQLSSTQPHSQKPSTDDLRGIYCV